MARDRRRFYSNSRTSKSASARTLGGHRLNAIFSDGFESGGFDDWTSVGGG